MRVKTFILATSAAGALALSAGTASAEPNGWYGAIDAGYHTISDDLELVSQTNGPVLNFETDDNWAGFARLGYRFTPNWRVELEGGYRAENEFGTVTNPSAGLPTGICNISPVAGACENPEGSFKTATALVNVIYDFGNEDWAFRPFVGLGAGVANVTTEFVGTLGGNRTVAVGADDSSTELAAQALAGFAVRMSDRANLDVTYRYLMTDVEFDTFTSAAASDIGNFAGDFDNSHTLTLGLRYAFGADEPAYVPPPAPAPLPPAPVPPRPVTPPPAPVVPADREFVVYFDWDRSDLTAEAQSVVTQAANYAKSGRPTRVLIVGHADTSGSAAYNVGLSNRRARTVGDALVAQGINGGVISLDGKGETALARATADGVREPLNRRATVGINFR
jgi:outer membrane protein OmpA-like peptidoglycan-associated protein/outer membrane protein W